MQLPLTFWDVSLVLAVTAITLLITAELASPYYGQTNLLIDKKRLRDVALFVGVLFLATVAVRIVNVVSAS